MRKTVLLCALALASCSSPAAVAGAKTPLAACEEFTRSIQDSPSTFRVVDTTQWEEPLTGEERKEARVRQPLIGDGTPGVMFVGIEFDIVNEFGAVVRGSNVCPFSLKDGEVIDAEIDDLYRAAEEWRALVNQARTGHDFPKMQKPVPAT